MTVWHRVKGIAVPPVPSEARLRMKVDLQPNMILDGYRLFRIIGVGGFGEVWLCRSEAMGSWHALKFIRDSGHGMLEKEHQALAHYRRETGHNGSRHLIMIGHINRSEEGLYYVMPLADGAGHPAPANPAWQPITLASMIDSRKQESRWFSRGEIAGMMGMILGGLQSLCDAGLVHRDVKPENILFFDGRPCLGDISLVGPDTAALTRRGTPGYATPSWYAGGHPDMYGAAATLYTLLTGNPPDKMGRAAFLWPPQGDQSLAPAEREVWTRMHKIVRRAAEERVSERYLDFTAMTLALAACGEIIPPLPVPLRPSPRGRAIKIAVIIMAAVITALIAWMISGWPRPESRVTVDEIPKTSSGTHPEENPAPDAGRGQPPPPATADQQTAQSEAPTTPLRLPAIDRSPRIVSKGSHTSEDVGLACNSLSGVPPWLERRNLKSEAVDFKTSLKTIRLYTSEREDPEIQPAIRALEEAMRRIPAIHEIPNARLARILMIYASGDHETADAQLKDTSFEVLGDDNLEYRVELLCRLGLDFTAERMLDRLTGEGTTGNRAIAFIERARLHARYADMQGGRDDAQTALRLVEGDTGQKQEILAKTETIKKDFPRFATWLENHPGG